MKSQSVIGNGMDWNVERTNDFLRSVKAYGKGKEFTMIFVEATNTGLIVSLNSRQVLKDSEFMTNLFNQMDLFAQYFIKNYSVPFLGQDRVSGFPIVSSGNLTVKIEGIPFYAGKNNEKWTLTNKRK